MPGSMPGSCTDSPWATKTPSSGWPCPAGETQLRLRLWHKAFYKETFLPDYLYKVCKDSLVLFRRPLTTEFLSAFFFCHLTWEKIPAKTPLSTYPLFLPLDNQSISLWMSLFFTMAIVIGIYKCIIS